MSLMNFTSIDFETANANRNSACSVAVVVIEKGRMTDSYNTLIRPPEMNFEEGNIKIHGITPGNGGKRSDFCADLAGAADISGQPDCYCA